MARSIPCRACGASINTGGVFPGARIACTCGAENVVTVSSALGRGASSPYRVASPPPPIPSEARAPVERGACRCPRCAGPLSDTQDAIHECTLCKGAFVPWDVLQQAVDNVQSATIPSAAAVAPWTQEPVTYLACPSCGDSMNRTLYSPRSGLVVDVCVTHGLWFDAGELERARAFPVMARRRTRITPQRDERIVQQMADVEAIAYRERIHEVSTVLSGDPDDWDSTRRRDLVERLVDVLFDPD